MLSCYTGRLGPSAVDHWEMLYSEDRPQTSLTVTLSVFAFRLFISGMSSSFVTSDMNFLGLETNQCSLLPTTACYNVM